MQLKQLKYSIQPHRLQFRFDAGTSRGVMRDRDTWFLKVWELHAPQTIGIGECAPLKGLSFELTEDFENTISQALDRILTSSIENEFELLETLNDLPSVKFALESALLDLKNGGNKIIFDTDFARGKAKIDINGLVWMGSKERMMVELKEKIEAGYKCVKIKIGALDFNQECDLLDYLRDELSSRIELRTDANGGFSAADALGKLNLLSKYKIHSIEQPIKPRQWKAMKELCDLSPIPIALDEELIGINSKEEKSQLLDEIKPQFIILKPTLLGGFSATTEWIKLAEQRNIKWWLTSALESNIGLNAIAQYASTFDLKSFPQGLGTGQLYHNNIGSSLVIDSGSLRYDTSFVWDEI